MNWQAINFDWNQVRAFLATVEEGSLSAAARALGSTQPTLGRQVAALEDRLGVTLFERSGRALILTPSGKQLVAHVRRMGEAATELSLVATGQATSVEGVVKIAATEMYSAFLLPSFVARMRRDHPGIVVQVVADNALTDLRHREADIAIRNTEPKDPDLIARRLPDDTGSLFATHELIAEFGPFQRVVDLAAAPFVGFGEQSEDILKALQDRGVPISERNFVGASQNHLVHWELAKAGVGIGLNATRFGHATPGMQSVLPDALTFEFPVWLVAPRELRTSPRVRLVFDRLVETLRVCRNTRNSLDGGKGRF